MIVPVMLSSGFMFTSQSIAQDSPHATPPAEQVLQNSSFSGFYNFFAE